MQLKDFVSNSINGTLAAGATSVDLNDASSFPDADLGPYFVGIWNSTDNTDVEAAKAAGQYETVCVTSLSGNTLTIIRGLGGTSDIDHTTGGKTYTVSFLALAVNVQGSFALSVKSFGAVGDGTTDDSSEFANAMDTGQTNSLPVFVEPGTYYVPWAFRNTIGNVFMFGLDRETCVIKGDGTNRLVDTDVSGTVNFNGLGFLDWNAVVGLDTLDASEVVDRLVFKDCRFDNVDAIIENGTTKTSGAAITFGEVSGCFVDGGGTESLIDIINDVIEFHFINNTIESQASASTTVLKFGRDNGTTSEENDWQNLHIRGNIFRACSGTGTSVSIVECYGQQCNISDNTFDGVTGGSSSNTAIRAYTRFSTIANNQINISGSTGFAIWLDGVNRGSSSGVNNYANVVSNNVIRLSGGLGIDVNGDENIISNNFIDGCDIGVQFNNGTLEMNKVLGNTFRSHTSGTPIGIRIVTTQRNLMISGNHFVGAGTALFDAAIDVDFGTSALNMFNTIIANNIMEDFSSNGIRIDTGTNASANWDRLIISNNMIQSDETGSVGIRFEGTNPVQDVDCWGNSIVTQGNNFTFTTRPEVGKLMQEIDDGTPDGTWVARLGALAVYPNAAGSDLFLKNTGDRTNSGWQAQE